MSDPEQDNVEITPEEADEIIVWALRLAASLVIIEHDDTKYDDADVEDVRNKLQAVEAAVSEAYNGIPDSISDLAHDIAISMVTEEKDIEDEVAEFMREVEGYRG